MIKNYLTLALKVLRRKPFYTFVSLFGISFTLMILMLITSMGDAMFGANRPMTDINRMVFLTTVERYTPFYDTTYVVDSVLMDSGRMRYDSTINVDDAGRMVNNGPGSYYFMDNNLRNFEDVENYSFYTNGWSSDAYLDGRKVTLATTYTDAGYWEVFDYNFIAGLPFTSDDVTGANKIAVMTDRAARNYFGEKIDGVVGREIELGEEQFRVVGIVRRPLMDNDAVAADVMLPVTTLNSKILDSRDLGGSFNAVFKATTPKKKQSIVEQLNFYAENFIMPGDQKFEKLGLRGGTHLQIFANDLIGGDEEDPNKAIYMLFIPLAIMVLLFVALPLINLVNLNISRVFERKSEIAVRKAFGADSKNILHQFIFENFVLTFIGGAIGLLLALGIINYANANDLLGQVQLAFSLEVFCYFLLLIVVFGLLSGLLPAYRMSRTNIGNALR